MASAEVQASMEKLDINDNPSASKEVIATKVTGTVKWFNTRSGYGFIHRSDTKEDVFVHQSAIVKNNPRKAPRSTDTEVEFDVVVGEKGNEAANVTGINGEPVKIPSRRYFRPRGGARGGPRKEGEDEGQSERKDRSEGAGRGERRRFRGRGGPRRPRVEVHEGQGDATKEPDDEGKDKEMNDTGDDTNRADKTRRGSGRGRRGLRRGFMRRGGSHGGHSNPSTEEAGDCPQDNDMAGTATTV